jgi:hypothetical protein
LSPPLPRRTAQAARLRGAAAAPLVGAGAAHADEGSAPQQAAAGGAQLGSAVDGASQQATGLAVRTAVPAAGRIVGTATPAARQSAARTTDAAGRVVGATAESLPVTGALPNTGALPAEQLPVRL